jgi:hypothetical protein
LLVQFSMGQEVWLMNPRSYRHKVATGTTNGFGGKHKFYFTPILKIWFKVDVKATLLGDVALKFH